MKRASEVTLVLICTGIARPTWVVRTHGGCLLWLDAFNKKTGCGVIKRNGKTHNAHKYLYELARGKVPHGLELDHTCMTRRCVNVDHMEPVTGLVNTQRYWAARTTCRRGHEISKENTRVESAGFRRCLICARNASEAARKRRRA